MKAHARIASSLVCLAAVAAASDNRIVKVKIESGGQARTCYLYVPPNPITPAPLLVLLHGSGRNGLSLAEPWKDLARKERFVLVAPDALHTDGWNVPQDGPEFLYDLVEAVKKDHAIDPRAVYVFGHSAGAVFALTMGLLESRYFAAVALHAGAFRDPSEFAALEVAKRKIPYAVFLGTNDRFFPVAAARTTRDAFVKAGFPFTLTEIRNHDHNYYVISKDINRQAWTFLRSHVLDGAPEYETYVFR